MGVSEDRAKAIEAALAKVNKDFGAGAAMKFGDKTVVKMEAFSTGSLKLDRDLGCGGIPRGRITEIYAQESVGKTTIALHAIADAQAKGETAVFIDAEHALDPEYARSLGVDIDNLIISQPDNGEQALEILETFVRSAAIGIIVVDSVAALVPKAEIEGDMGDAHMALQARLMSQALRKVTGPIHNTNTAVIFINQLRENIGAMGYGPKTTTTGGKALKFYATVRISMAKMQQIKQGDDVIGNIIKAKVEKNKLAPPFKTPLFEIYFGKGISLAGQIVDIGVEEGIVKKGGAWFSYNGDQLGQGKPNAIKFIEDNPELGEEILGLIKAKWNPTPVVADADDEAGE
jgi:recombination protein RecA